jgi:hypothetical protein
MNFYTIYSEKQTQAPNNIFQSVIKNQYLINYNNLIISEILKLSADPSADVTGMWQTC